MRLSYGLSSPYAEDVIIVGYIEIIRKTTARDGVVYEFNTVI